VSWKKQHNHLTLIADHQRRRVVWGCEGKGETTADAFFEVLDPELTAPSPPPACQPPEPAIMAAFGPCAIVPAGHGIPAAWLAPGRDLDPAIVARASRLSAIAMDMTTATPDRTAPPYAGGDHPNRPPPRRATRQLGARRGPPRLLERAALARREGRAKRFKDARWSLLKRPEKLTDTQAATLARIRAAGGEVWRAYTLKEAVRGIFEPGLSLEDVTILIDRLLGRLARSRLEPFVRLGKTIRKHRDGILAAIRLGINQGRTEALNNKVRLITRRAYGFHSANAALALIMLTCGPITLHLPHELHALGTA